MSSWHCSHATAHKPCYMTDLDAGVSPKHLAVLTDRDAGISPERFVVITDTSAKTLAVPTVPKQ